MIFRDRTDAGRRLAERLEHLRGADVVVLGLPRGGVPVAHEVAKALGAPIDVIVVRKLGAPGQPELAMGAIGEDGVRVLDRTVLGAVGTGSLDEVERRERAELDDRVARLRGDGRRVPLEGRTAVIVDDGIATGSTARAACRVARAQGAAAIVLAAPVAPRDVAVALRGEADEVVCVRTPRVFGAVGAWYENFEQTTDGAVAGLLAAER